MRYGMPYKGSKNAIAEKIVDFLPRGEVLVDLFGGGGAIAHCAALSGKWEKIIYNEYEPLIYQGFAKAISDTGYASENRWIDRETFKALKETDPYVVLCWSFGNNFTNYLYSKEIEPWKKALHYARAFGDFSLMCEFGIDTDGTRADITAHKDEYKEKYIKWYMKNVMKSQREYEIEKAQLEENIKAKSDELRQYLIDARNAAGLRSRDIDKHLGANGMAGHYFGRSQWEFPTREAYEKMQEIMPTLKPFDDVYGLMSLWQSLESLQSLERLQSLHNIECYNLSYEQVQIPEGAVIYCDPPYANVSGYKSEFDHERFCEWAKKQDNIFISEYAMPESDFECVASTQKTSLLSSYSRTKKTEKIYIPRRKERHHDGGRMERKDSTLLQGCRDI